jgi:hypothetical protein
MDADDLIDAEQAGEHLAYVRRVADQARLRVSQQHGAFMAWGLAWIVGYGTHPHFGEDVPGLWPVVIPLAVLLSWVFYAVQGHKERDRLRVGDRRPFVAILLVMFGLVLLPVVLLQDASPDVIAAYYPYVFGLCWLALGVFVGRAYVTLGVIDVVAALVSLRLSWEAQQYFLAVVGGGGFFLFGVWLRLYTRLPR